MPTVLRTLGLSVTAFREGKGLTQAELADAVDPRTNRSVIAHLEQGRRLPPERLLRAICTFLEMPPALWAQFTAPGFQRHRTTRQIPGVRAPRFRVLAVCGLSASGKTTLAHSLARMFGAQLLPTESLGRRYLPDLKTDPSRWAFEGQLAFLAHKSLQISEQVEAGRPIVLDRSLSEDTLVYAKYFHERGSMDARSWETYRTAAEILTLSVPEPDLYLYCAVSAEVAYQRVTARNRADQFMHDLPSLKQLESRYRDWAAELDPSRVLIVDSEVVDFRDPKVTRAIFDELQAVLAEVNEATGQLSLFHEQSVPAPRSLLRELTHPGPSRKGVSIVQPPAPESPVAYLAAPFTAYATAADTPESEGESASPPVLIRMQPPHGRIPRGGYRQLLLAAERELRKYGIETLIPHRDVNHWGSRQMTPAEAMKACTDHVHACDLIVAVPGMSHGSHYELGLAAGLGKPAIVLLPGDLNASFLASGSDAVSSEDFLVVRGPTLRECIDQLGGASVAEFLRRHFTVVKRGE